MSSTNDTIVREYGKIESAQVELFRKAVGAMSTAFPPTYATIYRHPEFTWLDKLNLKLENVLHTDQSYEFFEPLIIGDSPRVVTQTKSHRVRRGTHFLTLESTVTCNGVKKIAIVSSFIIKEETP